MVFSCIATAIHDTVSREYFQPIGRYDLTYLREFIGDRNYHKKIFSVYSENELTWGMWTTALVGIDWFVETYRGWDFMFEMFEVDSMDERNLVRSVGEGYLWTLDELPP